VSILGCLVLPGKDTRWAPAAGMCVSFAVCIGLIQSSYVENPIGQLDVPRLVGAAALDCLVAVTKRKKHPSNGFC
jgi:hypothetical protein